MCFLTMTLLLWSVVLRELLKFNLLMDINDAALRIAELHFVSQPLSVMKNFMACFNHENEIKLLSSPQRAFFWNLKQVLKQQTF